MRLRGRVGLTPDWEPTGRPKVWGWQSTTLACTLCAKARNGETDVRMAQHAQDVMTFKAVSLKRRTAPQRARPYPLGKKAARWLKKAPLHPAHAPRAQPPRYWAKGVPPIESRLNTPVRSPTSVLSSTALLRLSIIITPALCRSFHHLDIFLDPSESCPFIRRFTSIDTAHTPSPLKFSHGASLHHPNEAHRPRRETDRRRCSHPRGLGSRLHGRLLDHHGRHYSRQHAPRRPPAQAHSPRGMHAPMRVPDLKFFPKLSRHAPPRRSPSIASVAITTYADTSNTAHSRHLSWHLHLRESPRVWLVPLQHRNLPQHVLVAAQCHWLDEDQALPIPQVVALLHWHSLPRPAILGR